MAPLDWFDPLVRFFAEHGFWPGYALLLLGAALILETGLSDVEVRRRLRLAASGFAAIMVAAPLLAAGLSEDDSERASHQQSPAAEAQREAAHRVQ